MKKKEVVAALLAALCCGAAADTLTLTASDGSGKSSFDTWNVSGGGTAAPSAENDYVVDGGRHIRVIYNRTFGGNSISFGHVGGTTGNLVIKRADVNADHNIGFANAGAYLNNGHFTQWEQNRTPNITAASVLTVCSPESAPFQISVGDGANTNNSLTINASVKGEAGTELWLCAGAKPKDEAFVLAGDMSGFKGRLAVCGGATGGNYDKFPVRAQLRSVSLGGTLVVQGGASVTPQYTSTTFSTARLETETGAILLVRCNNAGTACSCISVTEGMSIAPGTVVRLTNEPYFTTTNGFDEVFLSLPADKGTIPLENFTLEIATWKYPLSLATNLVDGVWRLSVHKTPHDVLVENDSTATSPSIEVSAACTNGVSWQSGEAPHAGRMYLGAKGTVISDNPVIRTPWATSYVFPGDALVFGNAGTLYLCARDRTFQLLWLVNSVTVPLSLNTVPSHLRGNVLIHDNASDRYPVKMQAYFGGLNVIEADVSGGGVLSIRGRSGSSKPYGDVEFTAFNTNFTGKLRICADEVASRAASDESGYHERLFVTDPRNLGGPLEAFRADALELADYSELVPRNDLDLNVANRGVTIAGNATFTVNDGLTLAVSNDVTWNGALRKTGAGTLALNCAALVPAGAAAALSVENGFLSVGTTNAIAGVDVTFADGAWLLVDPEASGDVAAYGAVSLSSNPFGGVLPVAFALPALAEGETYGYSDVAVCTVADVATAAALESRAKRVQGYATRFSVRPNADGTATVLASIAARGMTIVFR